MALKKLPAPIPERLVPAVLLTPRAAWLWAPTGGTLAPAWTARVNRLIDKHRAGHSLVVFDAHC